MKTIISAFDAARQMAKHALAMIAVGPRSSGAFSSNRAAPNHAAACPIEPPLGVSKIDDWPRTAPSREHVWVARDTWLPTDQDHSHFRQPDPSNVALGTRLLRDRPDVAVDVLPARIIATMLVSGRSKAVIGRD